MIKKDYFEKNLINLFFLLTFIIHLFSINFHPTNFEGGYGQYADFFNSENKINYVNDYYSSQFNTYLFSLIASILNYLFPFIDGFQSVKILSALSYFFLGFGLLNILRFYKFNESNKIFIIVIFLNSIIWNYGFRAFNDLFAFSVGIYFFSRILQNYKSRIVFIDALFVGISVALKSYNLILLIPILIFLFSKKNDGFKIFNVFFISLLIFLPFFLLNLSTYKYLGFILAPSNEDLEIAIFGNNKSRDFLWVLNNFVFYLGYLTLISIPFIIVLFLKLAKENLKNIIFFLIICFFVSLYIQKYFFISSELDLGPLQPLISPFLYKTIIIFLFIFFSLFFYLFFKKKKIDNKKYKICLVILFTIIIYFLILSFIKASQRYIILPLPFFYLILFSTIQPRILIIFTTVFYIIINSLLLTNYYITSKSTEIIFNFLVDKMIIDFTLPNVIVPHVYHLYDTNYKSKTFDENKISVVSSSYKVTYFDKNSLFSSKVNILGYEIKKYSVIKIK